MSFLFPCDTAFASSASGDLSFMEDSLPLPYGACQPPQAKKFLVSPCFNALPLSVPFFRLWVLTKPLPFETISSMDTTEIINTDKNKSSPDQTNQLAYVPPKTRQINGIISTGSPLCSHGDKLDSWGGDCSNRSVPGSLFCGPHGGKLTLRLDGTLGIIGPGCYRAIASLAGLNHRYVSQVLQGKSNPTSNVLDKIAKVVGVDTGWLMDYINGQKEDINSR